MKVIGLGSPDDVRVRFTAREIDVLVDVLRDLRAKATRDAADTYTTTSPRDTRPIDDCHDRLRGIEGLLMQLEEQPPDNRPGAVLVAATPLVRDVAHEAAPRSARTAPRRPRTLRRARHVALPRDAARRRRDGQGVGHDAHRSRTGRPWLGRMMRPSPPARARAPVIGVRQPPARKLANLTAVRVLRTLEVLVFHAASPPRLAATMGIHDRTARRLLHALEDEGYLQRSRGNCRQRYTYSPTPRLLALAGQLAARLPLVSQGMQAVHQLRRSTGFDAYLVVPSYGDVIVLAAAGDHAPALWSLLPATDSAGGSVLLAYRQSWAERAQERARRTTPRCDDDVASLVEARAADVRRHGYAINTHGIVTSLAVPVPNEPAPLAALVLSSETPAPGNNDREAGDVASTLEAVDDAGGAAGRELQLARELAGRQLARPRKVLNGQYLRLREAESSGQRGAVARRLG